MDRLAIDFPECIPTTKTDTVSSTCVKFQVGSVEPSERNFSPSITCASKVSIATLEGRLGGKVLTCLNITAAEKKGGPLRMSKSIGATVTNIRTPRLFLS